MISQKKAINRNEHRTQSLYLVELFLIARIQGGLVSCPLRVAPLSGQLGSGYTGETRAELIFSHGPLQTIRAVWRSAPVSL